MSPKEKSKELVDKFIELTRFWDEDTGWVDDLISAKQCALIAVDEILDILDCSDWSNTFEYYQEVKQEIQKL